MGGTTMEAGDASAGRPTRRGGKYLTFCLACEEYGIEIYKVKEIIGMMTVTTIPQTPGYVKGVVNLRGKIIPVIDMRLKFGMVSQACTEKTCIIVVEIGRDTGKNQMGIIVDSVSEVLNIKQGEITAMPDFGNSMDVDYILGLAETDGGVKLLLDIDYVLSERDFQDIFKAA